jgi:hypothetical protein
MGEARMALTTSPELVLLHTEPGQHAFYTWHNIMITCWSQRATGPAIEKVAHYRELMDREHPEGVSVIYLIADQAGLPTPEARAGVKELMARFSKKRACLAILIQGEGFWASAMRAVITGVRMLVPLNFPMQIFGGAKELVGWLPAHHARQTGVYVAPAELDVVLERLLRTL